MRVKRTQRIRAQLALLALDELEKSKEEEAIVPAMERGEAERGREVTVARLLKMIKERTKRVASVGVEREMVI